MLNVLSKETLEEHYKYLAEKARRIKKVIKEGQEDILNNNC